MNAYVLLERLLHASAVAVKGAKTTEDVSALSLKCQSPDVNSKRPEKIFKKYVTEPVKKKYSTSKVLTSSKLNNKNFDRYAESKCKKGSVKHERTLENFISVQTTPERSLTSNHSGRTLDSAVNKISVNGKVSEVTEISINCQESLNDKYSDISPANPAFQNSNEFSDSCERTTDQKSDTELEDDCDISQSRETGTSVLETKTYDDNNVSAEEKYYISSPTQVEITAVEDDERDDLEYISQVEIYSELDEDLIMDTETETTADSIPGASPAMSNSSLSDNDSDIPISDEETSLHEELVDDNDLFVSPDMAVENESEIYTELCENHVMENDSEVEINTCQEIIQATDVSCVKKQKSETVNPVISILSEKEINSRIKETPGKDDSDENSVNTDLEAVEAMEEFSINCKTADFEAGAKMTVSTEKEKRHNQNALRTVRHDESLTEEEITTVVNPGINSHEHDLSTSKETKLVVEVSFEEIENSRRSPAAEPDSSIEQNICLEAPAAEAGCTEEITTGLGADSAIERSLERGIYSNTEINEAMEENLATEEDSAVTDISEIKEITERTVGYIDKNALESVMQKSTENDAMIYNNVLPDLMTGEPVEISFFSLDDENLVITSEQALEMFENTTFQVTNDCHQSDNDVQTSVDDADSESFVDDVSVHYFTDIQTINGDNEFEAETTLPSTKVISIIEDAIECDRMDVPPLCVPNEDIVSFENPENTAGSLGRIPTFSAEVEVSTSDTSEPCYTDLTPAANSEAETSSAVSEALQTLVGNINFDNPPGTTVDSTLDADGQFVVQVMAPGMNLSIPNQYFNQQKTSNENAVLETISESDILDALSFQCISNSLCDQQTISTDTALSDQQVYYPSCSEETVVYSKNFPDSIEYDESDNEKKRHIDEREENVDSERPVKKHCHSSVIAALRESIYRSKARKIVNQFETENEMSNNKAIVNGDDVPMHSDSQSQSSCYPPFESVADYGCSDGPKCRDSPPCDLPDSVYDDLPLNYDREYSSPPSNDTHGDPCEDVPPNCHSWKHCTPQFKKHKPYEKQCYCGSRKCHKNPCQGKCCSRESANFRNKYCRRASASSKRESQGSSSSSSPCCCGESSHRNSDAPIMMLRPEELSSMMKNSCGKDGQPAFVMMPSDTQENTDGDPLKVQLVYLVYPMNGRRMPTDALLQACQRSSRDTFLKTQLPCRGCSPNCREQYASSPLRSGNSEPSVEPLEHSRDRDPDWPDNDYQHHRFSPQPQPSRQNYYTDDRTADPEDYLRKPIEDWSYGDVIFFLMQACKELRINPSEVKFKSSDNGSVLLRMSPADFDILTPSNGQKLYDYFINFKTQHYMASACEDTRHSFNDQYTELKDAYSHSDHLHHHQINPPSVYSDHRHHHHPEYHHHHHHHRQRGESPVGGSSSSHSHYHSDSPSQEYVPQGAQYSGYDHHSLPVEDHHLRKCQDVPSAAGKTFPPLHSCDEMDDHHRKFQDLPSAAGKTFPPLHNCDEQQHSDPDESEDEKPPEPPKKRGPGRPPKPENEKKRKAKKTGRLWEFIRNLLLDPKTCPSLVRWENPEDGVFRIVQSDAIANKWGMRKNNEKMNYEKLSRAMRYYYKAKIFEPVLGKRLVYKFGANAKGWRPLNPNNPNFQNEY